MPGIYMQASIFVLPSAWDQWGLAANEAMAAGVPVIVSDRCGCAGEIVIPCLTGFVFPAGSVSHLAGYLSLLINDSDLRTRIGETGSNFIKQWSPLHSAESLLNLTNTILQCRK
jgi:glycosyltransferase involved in cell wall biosynthesis